MYTRSAIIYDAIYAARGKDYAQEAARIDALIRRYKRSAGDRLLDVACGTGKHLTHLKGTYAVEGLDLEPAMLELARREHPDVRFHQADMRTFDLGRRFDVLVCLFSAIGYVRSENNLNQTIANFARHLQPGGMTLVEPFISPEDYRPGTVHATYVDEPALKVARINTGQREGDVAVMEMNYLVGTPEGVEHYIELHELAMFAVEVYREAFQLAGLEVAHDPEGLVGRGLYIGVKPGP